MAQTDEDSGPLCNATAFDWATLILTLLAINVSWWLYRIEVLLTSNLRDYLKAVSWECVRQFLPGYAAYICLSRTDDPRLWASLYYRGPPENEQDHSELRALRPLTKAEVARFAAIDFGIVIPTIMTLVQFFRYAQLDLDSPVNTAAIFIVQVLPGPLIGYVLLTASALKLRRRWTVPMGILVLGMVLTVIVVCMRFIPPRHRGLWIPVLILYLLVSLPLAIVHHFVFTLVVVGGMGVIRVIGVGLAALKDGSYFPYCELRHRAFGGVYLAVGIIGALFALCGRHHWHPFKLNYALNPFGISLRRVRAYLYT